MNITQLKAFYSVIKNRSISKAAEELNVTEPAIFIQLRSLEQNLGCILLDKLGNELYPTEVGKILYDYAEKIFGLIDEASKAVKDIQNLTKGELHIGATKALAQYLLPFVISFFHEKYPHIFIKIEEGDSGTLIEGILGHRFEIGIAAKISYPKKINAIPFGRDEIILILSPYNKLSTKKVISIAELYREPLICTNIKSATKYAVWKKFESKGLLPTSIIEAGNIEFIKQLVKENRGYAFLARLCVKNELKKGELVTLNLEEGRFFLDIDLIHLKGKTLSTAALTFLNYLKHWPSRIDVVQLAEELISGELSNSIESFNKF